MFESGVAENYTACDPNASQGTCCLQGEACLESGLRYGSLGLVYRGACINEWSSDGHLTYCADSLSNWNFISQRRNLEKCRVRGLAVSQNWAKLYSCTSGYLWCGNDTETQCSTTSGTLLDIKPGDVTKILTASSTSTSISISSSATSTSASSTTTAANNAQQVLPTASPSCDKSDDEKVVAVGAGVGASLGALSLAMLALFLNERRRRMAERGTTAVGAPDRYVTENKQSLPYDTPLHEIGQRLRVDNGASWDLVIDYPLRRIPRHGSIWYY